MMEPTQPGTPLDPFKGTISEDLDRLEVLAGKIGLNSRDQALGLLHDLDGSNARIQGLEEGSQSRKLAETQFEIIVATLHKDARQFIHDLGGAHVLQAERAAQQPPRDHTWWYIDEHIAAQRKAALRRLLITGGAVVLALVVLSVIYKAFLAPDPKVAAVYTLQQSSQDALMNGDLKKAAADIDKGLEIDPKNVSLLVSKGVIMELQGQNGPAQQVYTQAQQSATGQDEFLLTRGQAYLMVNQNEMGLADAKSVIAHTPDSAQGHLLAGQAYEALKQYTDAMNEYNAAYDAASKKNENELAALSRARLAYLMQSLGSQLPLPAGTVTPTVTPVK